MNTVYLLHLSRPFGPRKVRHYLGATSLPLVERLKRHEGGKGASLLRAAKADGVSWRVVRVWNCDGRKAAFHKEIALKARRQHSDYCLLCSGQKAVMST